MLGRFDVVALYVDGGRGTGFFIAPDRLVTAWHVIAEDGAIEFPERITIEFFDRSEEVEVEMVAGDPNADWIVLATPRFVRARPLQLLRDGLAREHARWSSYGFPDTHPSEGAALSGHMAGLDAPRFARRVPGRMVPSLQLYCAEAAASSPQTVPGFSGAPVEVAGRIVGLIREIRGDDGVAQGGTIDATPIDAILEGLLDVGEEFDHLAELRVQHPTALADVVVIGRIDAIGRLRAREDDVERVLAQASTDGTERIVVGPELRARLPDRYELESDGSAPRGLYLSSSRTIFPRQRTTACSTLGMLAVRLGIDDPSIPLTRLFAEVRRRCTTATDWLGRSRAIEEFVEFWVGEPGRNHRDPSWGLSFLKHLGYDLDHRWRSEPSEVPGLVIVEGGPGAGKSMLMRALERELCQGEGLWVGPALRVNARACAGRSVADALREEFPQHDDAISELLASADHRRDVWLLVDGLDELPLAERRHVLAEIGEWPGPRVVTTRRLPEATSATTRLELCPLSRSHADTLIEREGAPGRIEELLTGDDSGQLSGKPVRPRAQLIQRLIQTPLGVSMLALADPSAFESRQELLRDVMQRQLQRAVASRRLPESTYKRFRRRGLVVLGAMAWRVFRERRTTMTPADLDWVEQQLALAPGFADDLEQVLEQSGFVQAVGPEAWEFSHLSFAEYAAALAIAANYVPWRPLLDELADPRATQVLLHLASFASHVNELLDALLSTPAQPLTALALATRALLEAPVGSIKPGLLAEVTSRHLRLATWLPSHAWHGHHGSPGGVGQIDEILWAIERHAEVLRRHADQLLDACHPLVRAWLDVDEQPDGYHHLEKVIAQRMLEWFALERPLIIRLRFADEIERLRGRGRGEWALALAEHLDHPDWQIQSAVRSLWVTCAPAAALGWRSAGFWLGVPSWMRLIDRQPKAIPELARSCTRRP